MPDYHNSNISRHAILLLYNTPYVVMIYLAGIVLAKSSITIYTVILFGVIGFLLGFLLKLQTFIQSKNKLTKMENEAQINRSHINSLKEKGQELGKRNLELGGKGGEE